MLVRLLTDVRPSAGPHTLEAGLIYQLDDSIARDLIARGLADPSSEKDGKMPASDLTRDQVDFLAGMSSAAVILPRSFATTVDVFADLFDRAYNIVQSGRYGRAVIDLQNLDFEFASTLIVPSSMQYVSIVNAGALYPTGEVSGWLEDDPSLIAFFNKYETVSSEGKTWSLRKPLVEVQGGNVEFRWIGGYVDGKGNATSRLSSGMRWVGNTRDRQCSGVRWDNTESYCLLVGTDTQNDGQVNMADLVMSPNSRSSRYDRTSYGLVLSGNDMAVRNLRSFNAHSPLLVAEKGATTRFVDADLFNGAGFDKEGYQHRVAEYHGKACTFLGGRLGNGQFHLLNPRVDVLGVKFGITDGTGTDSPDSYFVATSSEVGKDLTGFVLVAPEIPIDMVTDIPWFSFRTEGSGTWALNTVALSDLRGFVEFFGRGKSTDVQGAATQRVKTYQSGVDGAYVLVADATTTEDVGVGAIGNTLMLKAGDADRWQVGSNGTLKPIDDGGTALGSPSNRVSEVHTKALSVSTAAPTLPLSSNTIAFRRSGSDLQVYMTNGSGASYVATITMTPV